MTTSTSLTTAPTAAGTLSVFGSETGFVAAQRMAGALAASNLVPKEYQGNVANCLIALELSARIGASAFMVMQHLNIIHGRPSFSAQFIIATVNACGRFTPLRFEESGQGDDYGFRAVAIDKASGEALVGDHISWTTVKAEGWLSKAGSKWKTLPGQMFRYRAATFWARVYAPELLMGLASADEAEDLAPEPTAVTRPAVQALSAPAETNRAPSGMDALAAALDGDEVTP